MRYDTKSALLCERAILPGNVLFWQVRPDVEAGESFLAGQHVEFRLRTTALVLSIASSSRRPRLLDFCLRLTGSETDAAAEVPVGARLAYRGPWGDFTLDRAAPGHLFVATGTGIAPIRSMLLDVWTDSPDRPTCVLHGDRGPVLPPFAPELAASSGRPGRAYHVCLTQPAIAGIEGRRVTSLLRTSGPWRDAASEGHTAYLCGRPEMLAEAERILRELGFPSDRIRFEGKG